MAFLNEIGLEKLLQNVGAKLQEKVNVAEGKELMPTSKEANMMLVTDESGETKWEERTHWKEAVRGLLLETEVTVSEDAPEFPITNKIGLSVGETYTVSWAGTEYTCVAEIIDIDGILAPALGNLTIMGGSTGEDLPFILIELPDIAEGALGEGIWSAFFPLDTPTGTLSVFGSAVIYHKLEKNFLPAEADITTLNIRNGSAIGSIRTLLSEVEDDSYQIGESAFSEGLSTRASGSNSHAEGSTTYAEGSCSHAEGFNTHAEGYNSHAEGTSTRASGTSSHAEGTGTHAEGNYSHAEGGGTYAEGSYSHAEGWDTKATGENQHVQGIMNIEDANSTYAHIVGNGSTSLGNKYRSNAHTLDWDGNAWFSGDVYVGSTSGVDRDEGSKKLATEDYVDEVKATSSTVINIIEKYNIDLNQVYNTNFDLATYVNQAIQEATEEGKLTSGDTLYLPPAKYRVLTPIIVNKSVNLKFEGSLEYQGTDFAMVFSNYSYCTADINRIRALNGSCIKILSDSTLGHGPIIYSTFKFNRLSSNSDTGYCFYAEIKGAGYMGQNKFVGGQCGGGFCAFKINNIDSYADGFGGNLFESMAIEGGFKEGFHFTDWCVNNTLFNCNLEESGDGYIKGIITEGYNSGLKVIGSSNFYRSYMDLSDTTDGMVIGSMRNSNAKLIDSYAYIVRGDFVLEKHDRTKDLADVVGIYDMANVVVDYNDTEYRPNYFEIGLLQYNNEYTEFLTGNQCNGIILSKKYGHFNGINEFSVVFQRDNIGTFVIKNYLGEEISYEVPQIAGVTVRFKWVCEQNDEYSGEWKYSYEFADVSKIRDFLTSKDDVASYHSILNTTIEGTVTDAVGGRAASITTSFAPNGVFTELNTLTLDVNGNKYTTDLPANVYKGVYDWVTGEIYSTAAKILAKDKCQVTESGVNSSGINYVLIDGEGINFLDLIATNRYIRNDEYPYVDKSIRAKNNGDAYLYDSAIDLNNPAAILEGLELLFPSEPVTVAAHPKTITLKSGTNTFTTENGEVLDITYGVSTKDYINNNFGAITDEEIDTICGATIVLANQTEF